MRLNFSHMYDRLRLNAIIMAMIICGGHLSSQAVQPVFYDIDAAKAYCDSTALEDPEGIWIYPDDGITVMITKRPALSTSSLPTYDIQVIDSSDVRLHPGDLIGWLGATPQRKSFEISLFTERGVGGFLKPKTIIGTLNDEGECILLKKEKSKFNLRFTFNPSILLPNLWRIVRVNGSTGSSSVSPSTTVEGLVKIYPSYDGNGSSRRRPRYL